MRSQSCLKHMKSRVTSVICVTHWLMSTDNYIPGPCVFNCCCCELGMELGALRKLVPAARVHPIRWFQNFLKEKVVCFLFVCLFLFCFIEREFLWVVLAILKNSLCI